MSFNIVKYNSLITYKLKLGTQQFINGQFHGVSIGKNRKIQFYEGFFLIERHCPLKKVMFLLLVHVISYTDPSKQLANFDFTKTS